MVGESPPDAVCSARTGFTVPLGGSIILSDSRILFPITCITCEPLVSTSDIDSWSILDSVEEKRSGTSADPNTAIIAMKMSSSTRVMPRRCDLWIVRIGKIVILSVGKRKEWM